MNAPALISEPLTSEELRKRVLLLLAARNGRGLNYKFNEPLGLR